MQLSFVRKVSAFLHIFLLGIFFQRSFQRSFENAPFPNIFLGRSSKNVFENVHPVLGKKSCKDLPKFWECGPRFSARTTPKI